VNDWTLFEELRNLVVVYEGLHTYGGLAGRDLEAMAIGIEESMQDQHVHSRIGQVRHLAELPQDWGIPMVLPVGGHAVFLDARAFYPQVPQSAFPAQTLAAELYLDSGIRSMERGVVSAGRDPETGEHHYPKLELTRLTIPRRVYTQAHMDVIAESVKAVYDARAQDGLRAEVPAVLPGTVRGAVDANGRSGRQPGIRNITLPVRPGRIAAATAAAAWSSGNVSVTSVWKMPSTVSFFTSRRTPNSVSGDCCDIQLGNRNPEIRATGIIRSRLGTRTGRSASVP
jgi:hypothetical protein